MNDERSEDEPIPTSRFESVLNRILTFILVGNQFSPLIKTLLGSLLHQKMYMYGRLGYWPQIRQPRTFNENVMHRKLCTDIELFSTIEDKWEVRSYVAERVGEHVLPEVYHVTTDPTTIPFDSLPSTYVVKPTHMSGEVIFVSEDEEPNREQIKEQCHEWLSEQYGSLKGEYWYQNMEPRVMVEERLQGRGGGVPLDYKLFVFHGRVEYIEVDLDRFSEHTRRFYDREWNPQDFTTEYPLGPVVDEPKQLDEMIELAETLGAELDFVRVDLYQPDASTVYFGELTAAHGTGGERFYPQEFDWKLGELW